MELLNGAFELLFLWTVHNIRFLLYFPPPALPVVCVIVSVACRGVDIISNQPVEVLVATDTDVLHALLGEVQAVRVKVAQDHHVLERRGGRTSTLREMQRVSTGAQCQIKYVLLSEKL